MSVSSILSHSTIYNKEKRDKNGTTCPINRRKFSGLCLTKQKLWIKSLFPAFGALIIRVNKNSKQCATHTLFSILYTHVAAENGINAANGKIKQNIEIDMRESRRESERAREVERK